MPKKTKLSSHKFGGRNNGPARQRYWSSGRLEEHKVKNIMRDSGKTRAEAYLLWIEARGGRRMKSKFQTAKAA